MAIKWCMNATWERREGVRRRPVLPSCVAFSTAPMSLVSAFPGLSRGLSLATSPATHFPSYPSPCLAAHNRLALPSTAAQKQRTRPRQDPNPPLIEARRRRSQTASQSVSGCSPSSPVGGLTSVPRMAAPRTAAPQTAPRSQRRRLGGPAWRTRRLGMD